MVIDLYKQGVSPKEIARQLHMSLRDVYVILKREFGEKNSELSNELKALKLYRSAAHPKPVEVAIKLRIPLEEANKYYIDYKDSIFLGKFVDSFNMIKDKLREAVMICDAIRRGDATMDKIIQGFRIIDDLDDKHDEFRCLVRDVEIVSNKKTILISETQEAEGILSELKFSIEEAKSELARLNCEYQSFIKNSQTACTNFNRPLYW